MNEEFTYAEESNVVKFRIYRDDDASIKLWSVDGIDGNGNYTERRWSYPTFQEAVSHIPSVANNYGVTL